MLHLATSGAIPLGWRRFAFGLSDAETAAGAKRMKASEMKIGDVVTVEIKGEGETEEHDVVLLSKVGDYWRVRFHDKRKPQGTFHVKQTEVLGE